MVAAVVLERRHYSDDRFVDRDSVFQLARSTNCHSALARFAVRIMYYNRAGYNYIFLQVTGNPGRGDIDRELLKYRHWQIRIKIVDD
jgi:hypothetical protein